MGGVTEHTICHIVDDDFFLARAFGTFFYYYCWFQNNNTTISLGGIVRFSSIH